MRITAAANGLAGASELEELYKLRKDSQTQAAEEAVQKAEEAQHSNTRATFRMMDRHTEIVKESQERNKEYAEKRALERMALKRAEERSGMLEEMAVRSEERRDLLKASRPEYM